MALADKPVAEESVEPKLRAGNGPGPVVWWVGVVLGLAIVYLLSFGPVYRYSGTLLSQSSKTFTNPVSGEITAFHTFRTVIYPRWVTVVYRPAFRLSDNGFYAEYIHWWDPAER